MKAQITVTDENGEVFEGEVELSPVKTPRKQSTGTSRKPSQARLDFAMPERAFIKKHARGLSGPKKFTLLLAFLSKGKVGKEVQLKEIQQHWNKMTSSALLGVKFNPFYTTTAKENGWVDTTKQGFYVLCPSWKEALN